MLSVPMKKDRASRYVSRFTSLSTVMTFTPLAARFFISSTIAAFSAWMTEIATPATSDWLPSCRSFSICPCAVALFFSITTRSPCDSMPNCFAPSISPALQASQ